MNKINFLNLFSMIFVMAFAFSIVKAQPGGNPPPDGRNEFIQAPPPNRPNLLQSLGLSREQIQQIRRINVERRPFMQEAKKRLDDANFALDEAVYSDNLNEDEIQNRLRAVQLAHAEMLKNRILQETAIRKVLTPSQVSRFRQLREEFDFQKRQANKQEKISNPQPNPNRLKNLPKRKILQRGQNN